MRALITGGQGFVGHHLAAHLREAGDEVVAIDKETDVADQGALAPVLAAAAPDAIYHLAALTHVGESWDAPAEVLRVNVLGTAAVLAAARALANAPRVLVVSARPRSTARWTPRTSRSPRTRRRPRSPPTPPPRRRPRRWPSRPSGGTASR